MGHLVIEKLLKALYAKNNKNAPYAPKSHDLLHLAEKTELKLTDRQEDLLDTITRFNMNARYDDYGQGYSAENSYRPPIFTGTSGAGWGNTLWGNFKNQFIGMPTGITPGMDPAYMDYFEAERALMDNGDSVDIRTNRGYHRANTNRGMTTGVTILD